MRGGEVSHQLPGNDPHNPRSRILFQEEGWGGGAGRAPVCPWDSADCNAEFQSDFERHPRCEGSCRRPRQGLTDVGTHCAISPCPTDIKYAVIGAALGGAIAAVFLALKVCMIKRHLFDIDSSNLRSTTPGFNGKGAVTRSLAAACPDQETPLRPL